MNTLKFIPQLYRTMLLVFFFGQLPLIQQAQSTCTSYEKLSFDNILKFNAATNSLDLYLSTDPTAPACACSLTEKFGKITLLSGTNSGFYKWSCKNNSNYPTKNILDIATFKLDDLDCFQTAPATNTTLGGIGTVDIREGLDDAFDDELSYSYTYTQATPGSSKWPLYISLSTDRSTLIVSVDTSNTSTNYISTSCTPEPNYCTGCLTEWTDIDSFCNGCNAENAEASYSIGAIDQFRSLIRQLKQDPPQYTPLSSYSGRIEKIFLMDILSGSATPEDALDQFKGIFEAMDEGVVFYILINANPDHISEQDLRQLRTELKALAKRNRQYCYFVPAMNYCPIIQAGNTMLENDCQTCDDGLLQSPTQWAQDPFGVVMSGNLPTLLTNYAFNDFSNYFAATEVSAVTKFPVKFTPFSLNYGNMLPADGVIYIGADDLAGGMQALFGGVSTRFTADMRALYEGSFPGQKIVWVGDTTFRTPYFNLNYESGLYQPVYHLDMFMTPSGKVRDKGQEKRLYVVGELEIYNPDNLAYDGNATQRMARALDKIARTLTTEGTPEGPVKVARIPLPLFITANDNGEPIGTIYSLNNSLVETDRPGKSRVYVPNYEGKIPNQMWTRAVKVWKKQGFEVVKVSSHFTSTSASSDASLHCMTKVLQRN
ncbi:MAG: hypothetical protein AAF570_04105 [Bacteroidota bacterium]